MYDDIPPSFSSLASISNVKVNPDNNSTWNIKFKKFTLHNIHPSLNSDLLVVNKDIVEMPKLESQPRSLEIFWKDLAQDILTPFAPKNHSLLRFINKNIKTKISNSPLSKNSPRMNFDTPPPSKRVEKKSINNNQFFKLDSSTLGSPMVASNNKKVKYHKFSGINKSFEMEDYNNEREIIFEFKGMLAKRESNKTSIRRKSCHCNLCGKLTKIEQKHCLNPTIIKHHKILEERNKNFKKSNKLKVQNIISLKRNSFLKFLPKKSTGNIKNEKNCTYLQNTSHNSVIEGSFPSLDIINKKTPNNSLSSFSGTLSKDQNQNPQKRKSTMGFFYPTKSHKFSLSNIHPDSSKLIKTSREEISSDGKIMEETHEKRFSFIKISSTSETQKMKKINQILNNKDLKKKEHELCKLLINKFDSVQNKFIQNISNMKINYKDADSSYSCYFPNNKQGHHRNPSLPKSTPKSHSTAKKVIFFSAPRFQKNRNMIKTPFTQPKHEYLQTDENYKI